MNNDYNPFSKFLHWTIVIVIALQFVNSDNLFERGDSVMVDFLSNSHFSLGLLILPLALALLFMRFYRPGTRTEGEAGGVMRYAALGMQYLLYALMFLIPITGWIAANGRGLSLNFFGLFNLPELVADGSQYTRLVGHMHSGLAWTIAFLVVGHTGMALYHHFIVKDDALKRMLPKFLVK